MRYAFMRRKKTPARRPGKDRFKLVGMGLIVSPRVFFAAGARF